MPLIILNPQTPPKVEEQKVEVTQTSTQVRPTPFVEDHTVVSDNNHVVLINGTKKKIITKHSHYLLDMLTFENE